MQALSSVDKTKYSIGIQNVSQPKNGAFTGELSIPILEDMGVKWILIGHSERRILFGETDEDVAKKVTLAQESKLSCAVCIGETLDERNEGKLIEVIGRQLDAFIKDGLDWDRIVIAYEPVWAIGTGVVATVEQAQEAHEIIRNRLSFKLGQISDKIRIVYGGSVNDANCTDLITCPDVDGFLVGGASLKPTFGDIIKSTLN
ncbi:bifunctional Triosephosphate isomerase/Triosephosphate isomerase superfamily/Aldolase-type TIM barrel/Triosephosphate isomerase [Babesia duncani]|uniref:Triosephosphate isomerase n=1 Tax=Babesia duncani TaxID=323732 RepID=A0AAD9PP47_9APIC|nr:bifunctional Triosephosphate isomerase/Triosephosphate isomerase superfamily/Aldolase-type TIM barrel/Triosephosphate isomerase [Babesia duncani]